LIIIEQNLLDTKEVDDAGDDKDVKLNAVEVVAEFIEVVIK